MGSGSSSKADPEPSLNQPNSDSFWRSLKDAQNSEIQLNRECSGKGSSHSGFLRIIVTEFDY